MRWASGAGSTSTAGPSLRLHPAAPAPRRRIGLRRRREKVHGRRLRALGHGGLVAAQGLLGLGHQDAEYADVRGLLRTYPSIRRICFATGGGSAKIFAKAHAAWLKEPGAFRRRDDALSASAFPKVPTTGEGVELCILLSASPASNPRETWSAAKQRQKGHSDQWAARPAALYPFKRAAVVRRMCFADEPLVRAAAPFGASASDFRADEEGGDES